MSEKEIMNHATPAKVSNWNLNPNEPEQFRNLFPKHSESFLTNPKNVLYLFWRKTVKNQSKLIRLTLCQSEESIQMNPNEVFNQNHSDLEFIWIDSD